MDGNIYYNREKNRPYRVVVAHPGRQHSFELATALKKKGVLYKYITTVYDKEKSLTAIIKKFLRGKDLKKADGRRCTFLEDSEVIQLCEPLGLLFLLIQRVAKSQAQANKFCRFCNSVFSKRVGRYLLKEDIDAIIMFDSTAEEAFTILKNSRPDIIRIQDVSIATRHYMKHNFENDYGLPELKKEFPEFWDEKVMLGYKNEIDDSQYFLVASEMSRDSLIFCGVKEENISIIPYGVNHEQFSLKNCNNSVNAPLRIIYVGQVTYRKGIHHLLNVVSKFDSSEIDVYLAGGYEEEGSLYKRYKNVDNIHFLGFVTRDELAREYQNADVFCFPTIGEGYGLVVLEALSCGVPVISSDLAGGNDAIVDGKNGFVVKAGDDDELKEKIKWCISHRKELAEMRHFSHLSALEFTWERYHENVADAVVGAIEKYEMGEM